ncbi:GNAT family N-acetyltransferase [Zobellia galactanivorans]|uniref:GCN5-related N-acetyltransferase n=1 Tax=Zobellia galactanivorans (strain DSM 12802 / CCUG 47099 / CIP 106680 / NCIMB 13871 / Dsij) TaxID=63186 RepID=G0LCF9_ZOBGA|nr:GNAT family N-acetyltransferase [Zobellia galactanivorans]CAZ96902.1 GCN5-related N-acetyltransferase [Zobellia galactanivorans]
MDLLLEKETTERLLFRKIRPSDFETWLSFHQDKRSSEFWNGLPSDPNVACQQQFDRIFERYEKQLGGMNALISRSTGDFIGLCGLLKQTVDGIDELEIGYSILPKYWQQGYATEAALQCKSHATKHQLAPSLISIIHIDNLPSQKVAINNGMHLEKTTTYHNNPVYIFRVQL